MNSIFISNQVQNSPYNGAVALAFKKADAEIRVKSVEAEIVKGSRLDPFTEITEETVINQSNFIGALCNLLSKHGDYSYFSDPECTVEMIKNFYLNINLIYSYKRNRSHARYKYLEYKLSLLTTPSASKTEKELKDALYYFIFARYDRECERNLLS